MQVPVARTSPTGTVTAGAPAAAYAAGGEPPPSGAGVDSRELASCSSGCGSLTSDMVVPRLWTPSRRWHSVGRDGGLTGEFSPIGGTPPARRAAGSAPARTLSRTTDDGEA